MYNLLTHLLLTGSLVTIDLSVSRSPPFLFKNLNGNILLPVLIHYSINQPSQPCGWADQGGHHLNGNTNTIAENTATVFSHAGSNNLHHTQAVGLCPLSESSHHPRRIQADCSTSTQTIMHWNAHLVGSIQMQISLKNTPAVLE